tara:strand:- start:626 stop:796 length:171 start_codon:yes stop_codon:yes gene_type:complete
LKTDASIFAVAAISQKGARLRTRLNAGSSLMDKLAFGFVGQFAVGAAKLDLCIALA